MRPDAQHLSSWASPAPARPASLHPHYPQRGHHGCSHHSREADRASAAGRSRDVAHHRLAGAHRRPSRGGRVPLSRRLGAAGERRAAGHRLLARGRHRLPPRAGRNTGGRPRGRALLPVRGQRPRGPADVGRPALCRAGRAPYARRRPRGRARAPDRGRVRAERALAARKAQGSSAAALDRVRPRGSTDRGRDVRSVVCVGGEQARAR